MSIDYVAGDDHIVTITINRPEARNSMDMEHFYRVARRPGTASARTTTPTWRSSPASGKDFCVGADLKTYIPQVTELHQKMRDGEHPDELGGYRLDDGVKAVLRGTKLYKPIIAAVNGNCVAGGMEMLGGIDIRVAADTATFGVMEPKRGLFAGGGTTVRLPRQIPYPAAMEFLLCADQIPAQRALEMGVLNEVCRPADLMERAYEYARRITANGPLAVRKTKESVLRGLATDMRRPTRSNRSSPVRSSRATMPRRGRRRSPRSGRRSGRTADPGPGPGRQRHPPDRAARRAADRMPLLRRPRRVPGPLLPRRLERAGGRGVRRRRGAGAGCAHRGPGPAGHRLVGPVPRPLRGRLGLRYVGRGGGAGHRALLRPRLVRRRAVRVGGGGGVGPARRADRDRRRHGAAAATALRPPTRAPPRPGPLPARDAESLVGGGRRAGLGPGAGRRRTERAPALLPPEDRAVVEKMTPAEVADGLHDALRHGPGGIADDYGVLAAEWGFELADVSGPATVFQGAADTLLPMSHAEALAAQLPAGRLEVVEGAGHFVLRPHLGRVLDVLAG